MGMAMLINQIATNPWADIVALFSLFAGIAFIIFLAGVLSGVEHLVSINENVEDLVIYRTRAIWGVVLLTITFIVWEIVRSVVGVFT
jgi:hypothetical protein